MLLEVCLQRVFHLSQRKEMSNNHVGAQVQDTTEQVSNLVSALAPACSAAVSTLLLLCGGRGFVGQRSHIEFWIGVPFNLLLQVVEIRWVSLVSMG